MDKKERQRLYDTASELGRARLKRSLALGRLTDEVARAINNEDPPKEEEASTFLYALYDGLKGRYRRRALEGARELARLNELADFGEVRKYETELGDELATLHARLGAVRYATENFPDLCEGPSESLLRDFRRRYLEEQALGERSTVAWDRYHRRLDPGLAKILGWFGRLILFGPIWLAAVMLLLREYY